MFRLDSAREFAKQIVDSVIKDYLSVQYNFSDISQRKEMYMKILSGKELDELSSLTSEQLANYANRDPYNPQNKDFIVNEAFNSEDKATEFARTIMNFNMNTLYNDFLQKSGEAKGSTPLVEGNTVPSLANLKKSVIATAIDIMQLESDLRKTWGSKFGIQYQLIRSTNPNLAIPPELNGQYASAPEYVSGELAKFSEYIRTYAKIGISSETFSRIYQNLITNAINNDQLPVSGGFQEYINGLVIAEIEAADKTPYDRKIMVDALSTFAQSARNYPLFDRGVQNNEFLVWDPDKGYINVPASPVIAMDGAEQAHLLTGNNGQLLESADRDDEN